MVAKIFYIGTAAKCPHYLFPVLEWGFDPFAVLPAPVFVPKYPRDGDVPLLIPVMKDILQLRNHRDFPWFSISVFPLSRPQGDIAIGKRHIIPCQVVDLVHPSRS